MSSAFAAHSEYARSAGPPAGRTVELPGDVVIDLAASPYLADHVVGGVTVLPGAFYVETVMNAESEIARRGRYTIRHLGFRTPVVLGADQTVISVAIEHLGNGCAEYRFAEGTAPERRTADFAARLEIDGELSAPSASEHDASFIDAFKARAGVVVASVPFYQMLRANGNDYGPSFQRVAAVWRAEDECLGRLLVRRDHDGSGPAVVDAGLLDSMTQLLMPFVAQHGRTVMLRSIDRIRVTSTDFPEVLWGRASVRHDQRAGGAAVLGDIQVFDERGAPYLEFTGVEFVFADPAGDRNAMTIAIASNFTAEPIEDALKFWSDHFGVPVRPQFAPYNQVFQQMLDPQSALRKNRDGVNVVLLSLEEWIRRRYGAPTLDRDRAVREFGAQPRCSLPNGLSVVHLNKYETDFVYREVFEDQCYVKHGIRLDDGSIVVDIGANIGLFSLFVLGHCRDPRVYAFEPSPVVCELLRTNCDAYGPGVCVVNAGVGRTPTTAPFTFYERSSVFSGFHADEGDDREALRTVVRHTLNDAPGIDADSVEGFVAELTANRLAATTHECRVTTVSEIMREHALDHIDLLKIDAEKSELEILDGIGDADWPRIRQVVIEVHDRTGDAVRRVESILTGRGFRCATEQDQALARAGFHNVYATRADSGEPATRELADDEGATRFPALARNVNEFVVALRTFMEHAGAPLVLCVTPRSPRAATDPAANGALTAAETTLLEQAGGIAGVTTIGSSLALRRYPVAEYHNPQTHAAGHMPYTAECYAAIGTTVFRAIVGMKRQPSKVIALDADNTLWGGVCGEDGHAGVKITEPFRRLQEFMLAQVDAGALLCLCSKNNEQDVADVFAHRSEMLLTRDHFTGWRVNWRSKSDNLKSLAAELNVGLDAFVFVDDNPVACADVRACCPGVITVQIPSEPGAIPAFLEHAWAFDRTAATAEDRSRARLYQDNARRQRFREESMSLRDFIQRLQLRVDIGVATDEQIPRISQLTFRTNQFNCTTIRRTDAEVRQLLRRAGTNCLTVRVADRFGDYGLVGVVVYDALPDRYVVDTFLLSCRVLGRGVEHAVVAYLGGRALREGKSSVEFAFTRTEKNAPAAEFLDALSGGATTERGTRRVFAASAIAGVKYEPTETAEEVPHESAGRAAPPSSRPATIFDTADLTTPLQDIAERLNDSPALTRAIDQYRVAQSALASEGDDVLTGPTQTIVAGIWRKVLGRNRVGLHDNFFDIGGTSLKAIQVIAAIKRELRQSVSIVTLFECPTVALLSARLGDEDDGSADDAASAAIRRGQRRLHGQRGMT